MLAESVSTVAAVFATLYAGHMVADHWVQTHWQASHKAERSLRGWVALGGHVGTYTLVSAALLAILAIRTGLQLDLDRVIAALAFSAATHGLFDRRTPLRWIADRTGNRAFWQLGAPRPDRDDNPTLGTGAYALDQSAHILCLWIAALIAA